MSKNPFINAFVASGYISILVTLIFNSPRFITDNELGMMAPIIFLSLFVISAALMGYLFVYQPVAIIVIRVARFSGRVGRLYALQVSTYALHFSLAAFSK